MGNGICTHAHVRADVRIMPACSRQTYHYNTCAHHISMSLSIHMSYSARGEGGERGKERERGAS